MTRFLLLSGVLAAAPAFSQSPNPRGAARAEVGGATVTIDYGRPALGDRMLSDLLDMLPEDRVWRAGENQVTTLDTSGDLVIGGQAVPAGRYSLYLHIPDSGDWSLLVNRHLGIPLRELSSQAPEAMWDEPWPMVARYAAIEDQEQVRIRLEEADGAGSGAVFEIEAGEGFLKFAWAGTAYRTTLRSP